LLIALVATLSTSAAPQTGLVHIPGSRITIIPPGGYFLAGDEPILMSGSNGASLTIVESTRPFGEAVANYSSPQALALYHFDEISRPQELTIDGAHALRFSLHKSEGLLKKRDVIMQVFVAGDTSGTFTAIAAYPDTLSEKAAGELVSCISTIRWDREKALRPLALLNCSIDVQGGFKLFAGEARWEAYTLDGGPLDTATIKPAFLIRLLGAPPGRASEENLQRMMESMLQNIYPFVRIARVIEFRKIEVDGLSGYETVSSGRWISSDSTIAIYCTLLFHPLNFVELIGFSGARDHDRYLDLFRATARTFRRNSIVATDSGDCRRMLETGEYDRAIGCYEADLRDHPKALASRLGKADALRLWKRYGDAIHEYDRVIEEDRTSEEAYLGRATANEALDNYASALTDLDRVISLNSRSVAGYVARAAARRKFGDPLSARFDYQRAIELKPDSSDLYLLLGEVQPPEEAIQTYSRLIDSGKCAAGAYKKRGIVYSIFRMPWKSVSDFTAAIRLNPADRELYGLRGSDQFGLGNEEAAVRDLERATEGESKDVRALGMAGYVHGLTKHIDASTRDFNRCFAIDSIDWHNRLSLGIIRFLEGKYREAGTQFRKGAAWSNSAELRAWLYFSEFKAYGATVAEKNLRSYRSAMGSSPREDWEEIVRYLLKEVTEEKLVRDISQEWMRDGMPLTKEKMAEATSDTYFAIGMANYITGLKAAARRYWRKSVDTQAMGIVSFSVARALTTGAWKE
jgi:tetratricopeptide (TPR) repeat protein